MGLLGKKKTPEELLTEGRAQFESGDMRHMYMTLHGLATKEIRRPVIISGFTG